MKLITAIALIFFATFLFVACPLALIGSLNVLFNLHIPYNVSTWFASALLYYSFSRPGRFINKEKK
jgi:hypothetical protein